jgi:hypothetical protein
MLLSSKNIAIVFRSFCISSYTLLLSWNIVLIQVTKVLIKTLFPVPPHPITVICSGLNRFFRSLLAFFKLSHSFIFLRITYAILNCSSLGLQVHMFLHLPFLEFLYSSFCCYCIRLLWKKAMFSRSVVSGV